MNYYVVRILYYYLDKKITMHKKKITLYNKIFKNNNINLKDKKLAKNNPNIIEHSLKF